MAAQPSPRPARDRRTALWLWGPVGAYCAGIFLLSSISNMPSLPGGSSDKLAHAVLYGGLGFLVMRAFCPTRCGGRRWAWCLFCTVASVAIYGLSDEVHQLFVPHRTFDLMDLVADVAGGTLGAGLLGLWDIIGPPPRGSALG